MDLTDMAAYSLRSMRMRSLRSWLTIIGVVVGITAMVLLVGLVQGLKNDVEKQLQSFGPRNIVIVPLDITKAAAYGSSEFVPSSGKLYDSDYERVRKVASIEEITRVISGRFNAEYEGHVITLSAQGVQPDSYLATVPDLEIEKGRFITQSERNAVVLGSDLASTGFDKEVELGSVVNIAGRDFRVVGILRKSGAGASQSDSVAFMSFEDARRLLGDQMAPDEISSIRITIKEGESVDDAADQIESIMLSSHRKTEDNKDFSLVTSSYINSQVEQTTGVLSLFLGAIAGISLLVGAIGIANTMFMTVLERRQEIGLLKAVGMEELDIERLFITEAAIIGFAGGALGLLLGFSLILVANLLGFPAQVLPEVAAGAVVFSALVGMVAGFIPSRQAARLDAIEALRYE